MRFLLAHENIYKELKIKIVMDIKNINTNIKELKPRYQVHASEEYWEEVKAFANKRGIQINKMLLIAIALGLEKLEEKENNGELRLL